MEWKLRNLLIGRNEDTMNQDILLGSINIRGILYEDFVNYKKACLMIAMPYCDFKCNKECGQEVCQNHDIINNRIHASSISTIIDNYLRNKITKAIVFQGLEPFFQDKENGIDSFSEILAFIYYLRKIKHCDDDAVIYTGYTEEECKDKGFTQELQKYSFHNIIIKYGRYIPGDKPHYDEVLGVKLASDNQYAVVL